MSIFIENLSYTYSVDRKVFQNLSLEIKEGEFWGILGRNGAGKSTLIDLILGIKHPTSGKITIFGRDPNNKIGNHLDDIVFLSQDINLKGDSTVKDFLDFHSSFYSNYSQKIEKEMLEYFQLDQRTKIGALSTGQQKKVQIVAAFSSDTKIIIIDEITAVLDPETRHRFFLKLKKLNKENMKTVLLATNIAEDLINVADQILYIKDNQGEIVNPNDINTLFNLE